MRWVIIIENGTRTSKLANTPGMDEAALEPNCEPTYDEKRTAAYYAKALEIAAMPVGTAIEDAGASRRQ